jgi:folate-binding protein YgfZ
MTASRSSSPYLALPGAVEAEGVDAGVAAHYGDPYREQKALLEGEGFVDLSHRDVVRLSGPDRLGWLHNLTTQDVERLEPQSRVTTLILSPHGHIEHALRGYDDGDAFWAQVEPGEATSLVAWLDSMRFLMQVEVADVSDQWAVVSRAAETYEIVRRDELVGARADAAPCGLWAYEALRVARAEPRLGIDTDHKTIPNEVSWIESAVHLDKGCYRGQETVARVHNLGRPPRRLTLLHLDGSVDRLPVTGDPVLLDGRDVGRIGSVARHHELGPIALALVKRNVDVAATLTADDIPATQEPIIDPDAGLHVRPLRRT